MSRSRRRAAPWLLGVLLVVAAAGVLWFAGRRAPKPPGVAVESSPITAATSPVRHSLGDWLGRRGLDWTVLPGDTWALLPGADAQTAWAAALTEYIEWFGPATAPAGGFLPRAAEPAVRLLPPDRAWLVYVVDDIGFRPKAVERMLGWRREMIFSVIPDRPYSRRSAAMVIEAGGNVFIHQPMEPEGWPAVDPGKGALLLADTPAIWREILDRSLAAVPGAVGLNNHMGSRFSVDMDAAATVATWAAAHGLFLLDSLTAPGSKLYAACRKRQRACAVRDVFLDDDREEAAIDARISEWLRIARRRGIAVAVGHPHDATMDRLEATMPAMDAAGLRWVGLERWAGYTARRHEGGD